MRAKGTVVVLLGTAQTLAWASSYYLPAILAEPIAADLGLAPSAVFGAFSVALLAAAALGPTAGRLIDRWGGRPVLAASNVVLAAGLVLLALSQGPWGLFAAWLVVGAGMALGLYDAAFAALGRAYGLAARPAITGITLIAGFASTVGWPATAALAAGFGWREACLAWAALHLGLGLPLNLLLPGARGPAPAPFPAPAVQAGASAQAPARAMWLLALAFTSTLFVAAAMAAHLPGLLRNMGIGETAAIAAATLLGPAQVAARLVEFALLRRLHPLLSARLAASLHPLGAVALMAAGPPGAAAFACLHGAGNGLLTIAKGTLPLALFGPAGYGHRLGVIAAPGRVAQALAPLAFGLLLERMGAGALALSVGLNLLALGAFMALQAPHGTPQGQRS